VGRNEFTRWTLTEKVAKLLVATREEGIAGRTTDGWGTTRAHGQAKILNAETRHDADCASTVHSLASLNARLEPK